MSHVATVTIDNTKVSADLTDFVVYVDLSDLPASFWSVVANGGGDIRVYKDDDTTELAREVVSCDTTLETGELHIKFSGTLSSTVDTDIHIYADGVSSDYAVTATYGRNNVWSAYKTVLHMNESSGNATDSTGNATWTDTNSVGTGTGKVGKARDFTRSSSHHFKTTAEMLDGMSGVSISCWFNREDNTDPQFLWSFERESNANDAYANWVILADSTTNKSQYGLEDLSATRVYFDSTTAVSLSTWYLVHWTWDGTTMRQYFNGSADASTGSASGFGTFGDTSTDKFIGGNDAQSARYYDGLIDEFRVRQEDLGSSWYATEHNNQNSPSTFYAATAASTGTTVNPSAQSLSFSLPAETVTGQAQVSVNAQSATFLLPAETVTADWVVSPSAQVATFSIPAYIVSAGGTLLSPAVQSLTFSLPAEQILAGAVLSPDGQTLTFSVQTASVTADWTVGVDPQVLTVSVPTLEFIGAMWARASRNAGDWTRGARNDDY